MINMKIGRIKSVVVSRENLKEGMQIYVKNFTNWLIGQILIIEDDEVFTDTCGWVLIDSEFKQLVVEFEDGNDLIESTAESFYQEGKRKQLPLKFSQWQSALLNDEVDSGKEIEFEVIERQGDIEGYENGDLNKPIFSLVKIAKLIREKLYSEEQVREIWKEAKKTVVLHHYNGDTRPPINVDKFKTFDDYLAGNATLPN